MKRDPKLRKFASRLVALSQSEDGRIDAERVEGVLQSLRKNPPRDHRALLKLYARLIDREISIGTAVVESACDLSKDTLDLLQKHFTERTGRSIDVEPQSNPSLIAGTRVRLGDDVYEISIPLRLRGLIRSAA